MRVLVTGAGGFAGAHIARHLATTGGFKVVGISRRETTELTSVREAGAHVLICDVADVATLNGPLDAIVHCASSGPWCTATEIAEDNVAAVIALADYAAHVKPRAIIFFSSICVYGDIGAGASIPWIDEHTPRLNPDAYGQSKHLGELILAETGVPTLSLRLPGIIGLRASPRNWLPGLAHKLKCNSGRPAPIKAYNLDLQFNNAVHVHDLCLFIVRVLKLNPPVESSAVTLGARGTTTVRNAIERLAKGLGVDLQLQEAPAPKPHFLLSSERAIKDYGYDPMEIGAMVDRYASEVVRYEC